MLIFLIGFMGAGKTTLGQQLAAEEGFRFMDLDDCIVERAGRSIPEIFDIEGERAFRAYESLSLHSLTDLPKAKYLIACGGGTPCFGDNMAWMNAHGLTVYLRPGIAELTRRLLQQQAQRPLIKDVAKEELETFVRNMLSKREPYYLQAHIRLEGVQASASQLRRLIKEEKHGVD